MDISEYRSTWSLSCTLLLYYFVCLRFFLQNFTSRKATWIECCIGFYHYHNAIYSVHEALYLFYHTHANFIIYFNINIEICYEQRNGHCLAILLWSYSIICMFIVFEYVIYIIVNIKNVVKSTYIGYEMKNYIQCSLYIKYFIWCGISSHMFMRVGKMENAILL